MGLMHILSTFWTRFFRLHMFHTATFVNYKITNYITNFWPICVSQSDYDVITAYD